MNQKAIRRVFDEVIAAYKEQAHSVISEHVGSHEEEDAEWKKVDRIIKRWRKRIERLTERTQTSD